jgi:superfamily II DNA or RNA helicase
MFELYDTQTVIMDRLRSSLRAGFKSPLIVSPTGSGKTVMFAWLAGKLRAAGKRTVILNHRKEIAEQIHETLDNFGLLHDLIQSGSRYYNPFTAIHVASAFTLARRLPLIQVPDYLFVDEGHHAIADSTWGKIIAYWKHYNPKLITVGWTATPERLSGEGLGQTYDHLIIGPDVAELIALGRLSKYKMFAPPVQLDTSQLHHHMGDFVKAEVEELVDKPKITGNAITHYKKHLNGAPTLAFCNSIQHAENVAAEFRAAGFRAASIDGKMNVTDRQNRNRDFAAGQLNVMASCDLISEGYDVPGAIGCINLRPTDSLALCLQQWGRVLRTAPGKEYAIILDHVGNSARHGLPDSPREWSLEGHKSKRGKKDPDDIAIRQCPDCGCINTIQATKCKDCGAVFASKPRVVEEVDGELQEVDPKVVAMQFRANRAMAKDIESLAEIGRMRRMKNPEGWARNVLTAREEKKKLPTAIQIETVDKVIKYCNSYFISYQEFGDNLKIPLKQMVKMIKTTKPTQKQIEKITSYFDSFDEYDDGHKRTDWRTGNG